LAALAERLAAPVVTTPAGRAALRWDHPLSAQGWIEDIATTEFLEQADALLVVGCGLGELSTNYFRLAPLGQVIHLDADPTVLGANWPALALVGDARVGLDALDVALAASGVSGRDPAAAERAALNLVEQVRQRLATQGLERELDLIAALREAVPDAVATYWDMTILSYWAWSAWDARGAPFETAACGGLGLALPAALGAAIASGRPTLAVSGDGGGLYGIADLITLAETAAPVTWLVVDDSGYGVLRGYMRDAYGRAFGTDFPGYDYAALARLAGVTAVDVDVSAAPAAVAEALESARPRVVVARTELGLFAPTHLRRPARHLGR
jgi:acetolactate synthase-1/2/3 large subunit